METISNLDKAKDESGIVGSHEDDDKKEPGTLPPNDSDDCAIFSTDSAAERQPDYRSTQGGAPIMSQQSSAGGMMNQQLSAQGSPISYRESENVPIRRTEIGLLRGGDPRLRQSEILRGASHDRFERLVEQRWMEEKSQLEHRGYHYGDGGWNQTDENEWAEGASWKGENASGDYQPLQSVRYNKEEKAGVRQKRTALPAGGTGQNHATSSDDDDSRSRRIILFTTTEDAPPERLHPSQLRQHKIVDYIASESNKCIRWGSACMCLWVIPAMIFFMRNMLIGIPAITLYSFLLVYASMTCFIGCCFNIRTREGLLYTPYRQWAKIVKKKKSNSMSSMRRKQELEEELDDENDEIIPSTPLLLWCTNWCSFLQFLVFFAVLIITVVQCVISLKESRAFRTSYEVHPNSLIDTILWDDVAPKIVNPIIEQYKKDYPMLKDVIDSLIVEIRNPVKVVIGKQIYGGKIQSLMDYLVLEWDKSQSANNPLNSCQQCCPFDDSDTGSIFSTDKIANVIGGGVGGFINAGFFSRRTMLRQFLNAASHPLGSTRMEGFIGYALDYAGYGLSQTEIDQMGDSFQKLARSMNDKPKKKTSFLEGVSRSFLKGVSGSFLGILNNRIADDTTRKSANNMLEYPSSAMMEYGVNDDHLESVEIMNHANAFAILPPNVPNLRGTKKRYEVVARLRGSVERKQTTTVPVATSNRLLNTSAPRIQNAVSSDFSAVDETPAVPISKKKAVGVQIEQVLGESVSAPPLPPPLPEKTDKTDHVVDDDIGPLPGIFGQVQKWIKQGRTFKEIQDDLTASGKSLADAYEQVGLLNDKQIHVLNGYLEKMPPQLIQVSGLDPSILKAILDAKGNPAEQREQTKRLIEVTIVRKLHVDPSDAEGIAKLKKMSQNDLKQGLIVETVKEGLYSLLAQHGVRVFPVLEASDFDQDLLDKQLKHEEKKLKAEAAVNNDGKGADKSGKSTPKERKTVKIGGKIGGQDVTAPSEAINFGDQAKKPKQEIIRPLQSMLQTQPVQSMLQPPVQSMLQLSMLKTQSVTVPQMQVHDSVTPKLESMLQTESQSVKPKEQSISETTMSMLKTMRQYFLGYFTSSSSSSIGMGTNINTSIDTSITGCNPHKNEVKLIPWEVMPGQDDHGLVTTIQTPYSYLEVFQGYGQGMRDPGTGGTGDRGATGDGGAPSTGGGTAADAVAKSKGMPLFRPPPPSPRKRIADIYRNKQAGENTYMRPDVLDTRVTAFVELAQYWKLGQLFRMVGDGDYDDNAKTIEAKCNTVYEQHFAMYRQRWKNIASKTVVEELRDRCIANNFNDDAVYQLIMDDFFHDNEKMIKNLRSERQARDKPKFIDSKVPFSIGRLSDDEGGNNSTFVIDRYEPPSGVELDPRNNKKVHCLYFVTTFGLMIDYICHFTIMFILLMILFCLRDSVAVIVACKEQVDHMALIEVKVERELGIRKS